MIGDKLYRLFFGTLRRQIIVSVALVHAAMMTMFIWDLTLRQQTLILDRQEEQATALARSLATSAADWLGADDVSGLQEMADTQGGYPELEYAMFLDEDGKVLAHTDRSRLGAYILDLPEKIQESVLVRSVSLVDVIVPAKLSEHLVGWVRIGVGNKLAGKKLEEVVRSGVLYTWGAIFVGSLFAGFLGTLITRRLNHIQVVMEEVRKGNHRARSNLTGTDEVAGMAVDFNMMLDMLGEGERDVRQSEEKYRSLIHRIQTAIVVHGPRTEVLISNSLAQSLLGFTEDEIQGKMGIDPAWQFSREDGSLMAVEEYPVNQVVATRKPLRNLEIGIRRPDGESVIWALVNAVPEFKEDGQLSQVLVNFTDISERKQAEKNLAERMRLAELSADIGCALARQGDLRDILNECAEALVRHLKVAFARIWTLDSRENILELQASAGLYTRLDGLHGRVPVGKFKIGMIAQEQKPHITNSVIGDPLVHDQEWAKREGMVSFAGHPLTIEDKLVGAMAMFSRNQLSDVTLKALPVVSNEIAIGIERKKAEEAVLVMGRELQTIYDNTYTMFAYLDRNFNFIRVNRAYSMADGRPPEFFTGKNHFELYPHAENEAIFRKVVDTGRPFVTLAKPFSYPDAPEKGVTYWDWSLVPVFNAEKTVTGLIFTLLDVTQRTRAEQELATHRDHLEELVNERTRQLRQSEEHYRRLFETMLQGVVYQDADGRVISMNPAAERILGKSKSELCGKTLAELESDTFREDETRYPGSEHPAMVAIHSGKEVRDVVMGVFNPVEKCLKWISISAVPIFKPDGGKPWQVYTILDDISDRKQSENEIRRLNQDLQDRAAALEVVNKDLEAFAYSVAHDLRAPLRHINGFLELLREELKTGLNGTSLEYMNTISDSARKMGRLIDDLLAFSRLGRSEMLTAPVDLNALVREVVHSFELETAGRKITWNISPLPVVSGDRNMLRQVLVNLISNALKYTRPRPQADIEVGRVPGPELETVFVKDNGVGFDMDYVGKLFGVFHRLHRVEEFEGNGIGLANVRQIISRHGGKTWAEGKEDHGATFFFSLRKQLSEEGNRE